MQTEITFDLLNYSNYILEALENETRPPLRPRPWARAQLALALRRLWWDGLSRLNSVWKMEYQFNSVFLVI
ncbi:hypothetical protein TNCV_2504891 [Trichonephila clavipes]|uniref:Uncharacterized protein n=1 Tax=Trichonephila clavipes TaxID=2585209 RepID=A0A8X7BJK4_TRICX|nr:hypothetical protein TNCV_2504891 [Trichonephila clavipes]